MEKETRFRSAERNKDKEKSRFVRDWGELEKNGGEWGRIRGKGWIWMGGESRSADYMQITNNLKLINTYLSVSGNQVNNQENNQYLGL